MHSGLFPFVVSKIESVESCEQKDQIFSSLRVTIYDSTQWRLSEPFTKMKKIFILTLLLINSMAANSQETQFKSGVYHWNDLDVRAGNMREGRRFFEGSSHHFDYLEIHATTQQAGAKPAPPHTQKDIEEIIIVKEGKMKMTMDGESRVLEAGSVILIPPLVEQSLENVGEGPLTYYVFMFRAKNGMDLGRGSQSGGKLFASVNDLTTETTKKGERVGYFDRPTVMCRKLEMHVTQLNNAGPSHNPHQHEDSEIILVLKGEVGVKIDGVSHAGQEGDIFFASSGALHGVSNLKDMPCRYFAIRWQ